MRWPHQSWREMHQSWMFRIQSKYVFVQVSGTKRTSPFSTAAIAGSASGWIFTNHCVERYGSMIGVAALAVAEVVDVGLGLDEPPLLLEPRDHALARLEAVQARELPGLRRHLPVCRR